MFSCHREIFTECLQIKQPKSPALLNSLKKKCVLRICYAKSTTLMMSLKLTLPQLSLVRIPPHTLRAKPLDSGVPPLLLSRRGCSSTGQLSTTSDTCPNLTPPTLPTADFQVPCPEQSLFTVALSAVFLKHERHHCPSLLVSLLLE